MIIKLQGIKAIIEPMPLPELTTALYVQYIFERGTEHLVPIFNCAGKQYKGNKIFIDISTLHNNEVSFYVTLSDLNGTLMRRYDGKVPYFMYCALSKKAGRDDFETYVRMLENNTEQLKIEHACEIKKLNDRIIKLEELGDII